MIESVTLTCFRKHVDATFTFTAGLNVIRGANEDAKTTILEAIGYAMWGTKALRVDLADAVTDGQPESALRVVLVQNIDGVRYTTSRGKSGAEIIYGDQSVTGQKETRLFMERLLNCSSDIAAKLPFADQNAIRGILAEGPTATSGLVETLSDLGLIETLIDKIQAQLPSGNTGAIESQVTMLEANPVAVPELPSESAGIAAKAEFSQISEKHGLSVRAVPGDQEVASAVGAVKAFDAAQADLVRRESRCNEIVSLLGVAVTAPAFSEADLANARAQVAGVAEMARRRKAYATKFPTIDIDWDESMDAYHAEVADNKAHLVRLRKSIKDLTLKINTAKVTKINEKTCGLCQKDLTDVPEVVQRNLESDATIAKLTKQLDLDEQSLDARENTELLLQKLWDHSVKVAQLAGEYWFCTDTLPPVVTWIGEVPTPEVAMPDVAGMEKALKAHHTVMVRRASLQEELSKLSVADALPDVEAERTLIAQHQSAVAQSKALEKQMNDAQWSVNMAVSAYEGAQILYASKLEQIAARAAQLVTLKKTLADMYKHNELIKRLRSIRPQVATQLWATVLGATSHYFSMIRGQSSVVTRDTAGFKVDGKNVARLSGSTLDALGLAIRMSLSKLFLPNIPYLFLDEAFAGADDERELAGISTIASAGFAQVLLVTHSSLPETIADNLLVL